jgi:hypothetical protein
MKLKKGDEVASVARLQASELQESTTNLELEQD